MGGLTFLCSSARQFAESNETSNIGAVLQLIKAPELTVKLIAEMQNYSDANTLLIYSELRLLSHNSYFCGSNINALLRFLE